jgi:hypothetical protein
VAVEEFRGLKVLGYGRSVIDGGIALDGVTLNWCGVFEHFSCLFALLLLEVSIDIAGFYCSKDAASGFSSCIMRNTACGHGPSSDTPCRRWSPKSMYPSTMLGRAKPQALQAGVTIRCRVRT